MFQIQDKTGTLTSVLCFLLLMCYHGSRDALITSLHTIALCTNNNQQSTPGFEHKNEHEFLPNHVPGDQVIGQRVWFAENIVPREEDDGTVTEPTYDDRGILLQENISGDIHKKSSWRDAETENASGDEIKADRGNQFRSTGSKYFSNSSTLSDSIPTLNNTSIGNLSKYLNNNNTIDYDQILEDILSYEKRIEDTGRTKRDINISPRDVQDYNSLSMPSPLQRATAVLVRSEQEKISSNLELRNSVDPYYLEYDTECDVESQFGDWMYMNEWDYAMQGTILTVFHWMTVFGLFLGHYCIESSKVRESLVTALFVFIWGILALSTQFTANWGPFPLVGHRAWQGIMQGACYPCIYRLLEARGVHGRLFLAIIFSGPWCGTALGTVLGTLPLWPIPFYISGSVALAVATVLLFLAPGTAKQNVAVHSAWRVVVQRDVVVTALIHGGSVWVLHTLLIAPTLVLEPHQRWWVLLVMVTAGGLTAQLLEAVVDYFVPYKNVTARGHLLSATIIGFAGTVISLVMIAVAGYHINGMMEDEYVDDSNTGSGRGSTGEVGAVHTTTMVVIGCTVGMIFAVGVTSVGYRQVLEVADSRRRSRALVCVNAAGAIGAALASFLMPSMAITMETYMSCSFFPLTLVILAVVLMFIFLLFPTTKFDEPDIDKQESTVYTIPIRNGVAGRRSTDGMSLHSIGEKSCRSMMSVASFKTAVSRSVRSRTTSFNTVQEEDESSLDYRSFVMEGDEDMFSVQSANTSYRSHMFSETISTSQQPSFCDLPENNDSRISAWLNLHQQGDMNQWIHHNDTTSLTLQPLPGLLC